MMIKKFIRNEEYSLVNFKQIIEKIKSNPTKLIDFLLFLFLTIPYISLFISFDDKYFSPFFGLGLLLLLPIGSIIVITQQIVDKKIGHKDPIIFILSILTMICGICGWMMIFVVTG